MTLNGRSRSTTLFHRSQIHFSAVFSCLLVCQFGIDVMRATDLGCGNVWEYCCPGTKWGDGWTGQIAESRDSSWLLRRVGSLELQSADVAGWSIVARLHQAVLVTAGHVTVRSAPLTLRVQNKSTISSRRKQTDKRLVKVLWHCGILTLVHGVDITGPTHARLEWTERT